MQSRYVKERLLLLTRIWSSPGAFADLPRRVPDFEIDGDFGPDLIPVRQVALRQLVPGRVADEEGRLLRSLADLGRRLLRGGGRWRSGDLFPRGNRCTAVAGTRREPRPLFARLGGGARLLHD